METSGHKWDSRKRAASEEVEGIIWSPTAAKARDDAIEHKRHLLRNHRGRSTSYEDFDNDGGESALVVYDERPLDHYRGPPSLSERGLRPGVVATSYSTEGGVKYIHYEPISFGNPEYYEYFNRKFIKPFADRPRAPHAAERSLKRARVSDADYYHQEEAPEECSRGRDPLPRYHDRREYEAGHGNYHNGQRRWRDFDNHRRPYDDRYMRTQYERDRSHDFESSPHAYSY